ncbi:MAG: ATP-binding protein [Planctomycetota bacterium]
MSDPRIIKLSQAILESAIDEWNRILALSSIDQSAQDAIEELSDQVRSWIPELAQSLDTPWPQSSGQLGLLPWLLWLSEKLQHVSLSLENKAALEKSLQRAVSLLSSCSSIQDSVEASARRQVYELAYGLTHEINNPLGNIFARAQQILSKSTDPHDRKSLSTIVDQAMRAHEMLAEVMRAVQPRDVHLSNCDLVALIQKAHQQGLETAESKKIACRLKLDCQVAWANVDPAGILEALRLLAQNAIEACRQEDSIEWSLDEQGRYFRIIIQDTGPGLSQHSIRRAFDLFYSGREAGRGLGVSLAVVRRLVSESGGQVRLFGQEKLGCNVEIRFPKMDTPSDLPREIPNQRTWKI